MTNAISTQHPLYIQVAPDWTLMRDAYTGERQIKGKGAIYLPFTQSQLQDGVDNVNQAGWKAYDAYRKRARFPNFVREAVQTAVGMMHAQPAKISLPVGMEKIVSVRGENLQQILRKINEEQLITGRCGLLLDLPNKPSATAIPYIAFYNAERIINWDDGRVEQLVPQILNLVVLNETESERTEIFSWETKSDKYRVLVLGDPLANESDGVYRAGIFDDAGRSFRSEALTTPSFRGSELKEIPFVIVNCCDLVSETDEPPLLDLGNMCMTIYRGDADYRQNLFMQGQDTLVVIGSSADEDEAVRIGAGARIDVPMGGDVKYAGVNSNGLEEQRTALENLEKRAGTMGAQTLDSTSRERESGVSMQIRVAARTADLHQIALTGAKGLENLLKIAARWMRLDSDEVSVEPNLKFGGRMVTGQSMVEMQTARNLGYPISAKSLHDLAVDEGLTKLTFEEEMAQARSEEDTPFAKAQTGDRNPDQVGDGVGA